MSATQILEGLKKPLEDSQVISSKRIWWWMSLMGVLSTVIAALMISWPLAIFATFAVFLPTIIVKIILPTAIIPAAWLSTLQYIRIPFGLHRTSYTIAHTNYSTRSNSRCSMIAVVGQGSKLIQDRKLVVTFHGNAMLASHSVANFLNLVQQRPGRVTNDFIGVEFPDNASSSRELVDAAVAAIRKAIAAGYQPQNITIAGHSLGAAIAAEALAKIARDYPEDLRGQNFAGYISHKSFTKLTHVVTQPGMLRSALNCIASAFDLQLDAEAAIRSQKFPVQQMKFYKGDGYGSLNGSSGDGLMPNEESIATAMQNNPIAGIPLRVKEYSLGYDQSNGLPYGNHNGFFSPSLFKPSKPAAGWTAFAQKRDRQARYAEGKTYNQVPSTAQEARPAAQATGGFLSRLLSGLYRSSGPGV